MERIRLYFNKKLFETSYAAGTSHDEYLLNIVMFANFVSLFKFYQSISFISIWIILFYSLFKRRCLTFIAMIKNN